jgi:exo-1,4-beta-D-glucosaminidase
LIRDMNLNAIRLEGKMETEAFFEFADAMGIMVLPGIGCCDGWQHWAKWGPEQYVIAKLSIRDQIRRLESHPSVIAFFISSDDLPPPNVEAMYDAVLAGEGWPNPKISSASQQPSTITGPSGVKMVGPYSWVPPSYWLVDGNGLKDFNGGGAWGFFTEGGPGEAPMTFASWKRTVPPEHLWDADGAMGSWWDAHMGCPWGHFRNLTYYNPPLLARYGNSHSASNYLYKSQAANYEGIRAYFESYNRNKHRNATGFIQWMINDALPTHLWHLFDWYLIGGGGYYAAKLSGEPLHAMYSYDDGSVWLVNSLYRGFSNISIVVNLRFLNSTVFWSESQWVAELPGNGVLETGILVPTVTLPSSETYFVELLWFSGEEAAQSNWYWLSSQMDVIDFPASNGFRTPCTSWANLTQLQELPSAHVTVTKSFNASGNRAIHQISNVGSSIAFLIYLRYIDKSTGLDVSAQMWSDNFITLAPGQNRTLDCDFKAAVPKPTADSVELVVETWNEVVGRS